jgi:hypothetical protein
MNKLHVVPKDCQTDWECTLGRGDGSGPGVARWGPVTAAVVMPNSGRPAGEGPPLPGEATLGSAAEP